MRSPHVVSLPPVVDRHEDWHSGWIDPEIDRSETNLIMAEIIKRHRLDLPEAVEI